MTAWNEFETDQPEFAGRVRARFEETGLALAATLRADGAPRLCGWEPLFALGELWLGGMPGSRKSSDVRRDPRLCLHNATTDKDAKAGDAKISGRAVEVTDDSGSGRVRGGVQGSHHPGRPHALRPVPGRGHRGVHAATGR